MNGSRTAYVRWAAEPVEPRGVASAMTVCRGQLRIAAGLLLVATALGCRPDRVDREGSPPDGANLIVFIGQRISVTPASRPRPPGVISLDNEFAAHYRVDSVLYGTWTEPEIRFAVFDHYGAPGFAAHETVLLYVSRHNGEWIHQKYLFSPLYRTASGELAGCGDPYVQRPDDEPRTVVPRPIQFAQPVTFPRGDLTADQIATWYPSPVFVVSGDRIECHRGNTPAELFRVAREGVLKARGVF